MTDDPRSQRLAGMDTSWTMICRAHQGPDEGMAQARAQLLETYEGAVRRYLHTALRDPEAVDEVYQEFALRFCRGDFRRADPAQGRFRDFLSRALRNLIVDYRRRRHAQPHQIHSDTPEPAVEAPPDAEAVREWLTSWRDELLQRTWERLSGLETQAGRELYLVLRLRAENPELRSPQLAQQLAQRLEKPVSAEMARQLLHRARVRFANHLVEEVKRSLNDPTAAGVEEELGELGLLEYCRPLLGPRGKAK
jgi:RNA polymerase sigma-70 factor (ECF subfamily)